MTAILGALLLAPFAGPSFVVYPVPEADAVALEAVVALGEIGPRDELALMAVADCLLDGTEEYSKAQLRRFGGQTGRPPQVEMMPGFIRIGISMPKGQASTGAALMDSLLRRAQLLPASLGAWNAEAKSAAEDHWQTALWPSAPRARDLRMTDVSEAYRRWFRPENVTIGIGGSFSPDEESKLRARFVNWAPPKLIRAPFDGGFRSPALSNRTAVSTIEIRSAPFKPGDADFSAKLVTVFALGVGKGSSLFRIAREKSGFSYRQETLIWPSSEGLVNRMIIAHAGETIDASKADQWRVNMLADVETWTDAHLVRAQGVAAASLKFGIGYRPIYLSGSSPLGSSLEDQTLIRAYWESKTGSPWDPDAILDRMSKVTLDELKNQSKSMLEKSKTHAILGLGKP